mmetsp:Transcript_2127/g.3460  ORF Transcript_2127/g.3460 Transcript_2127/m.3460 type:complete len:404 (-) Transcript_2127:153-1364(-)
MMTVKFISCLVVLFVPFAHGFSSVGFSHTSHNNVLAPSTRWQLQSMALRSTIIDAELSEQRGSSTTAPLQPSPAITTNLKGLNSQKKATGGEGDWAQAGDGAAGGQQAARPGCGGAAARKQAAGQDVRLAVCGRRHSEKRQGGGGGVRGGDGGRVAAPRGQPGPGAHGRDLALRPQVRPAPGEAEEAGGPRGAERGAHLHRRVPQGRAAVPRADLHQAGPAAVHAHRHPAQGVHHRACQPAGRRAGVRGGGGGAHHRGGLWEAPLGALRHLRPDTAGRRLPGPGARGHGGGADVRGEGAAAGAEGALRRGPAQPRAAGPPPGPGRPQVRRRGPRLGVHLPRVGQAPVPGNRLPHRGRAGAEVQGGLCEGGVGEGPGRGVGQGQLAGDHHGVRARHQDQRFGRD